jgi:hypothetical protein
LFSPNLVYHQQTSHFPFLFFHRPMYTITMSTIGDAVSGLNPLTYKTQCSKGTDACVAGFGMGVMLVLLIIIVIYFFFSRPVERLTNAQIATIYGGPADERQAVAKLTRERFSAADAYSNPEAQRLLAKLNSEDPRVSRERFSAADAYSNPEAQQLLAKLQAEDPRISRERMENKTESNLAALWGM